MKKAISLLFFVLTLFIITVGIYRQQSGSLSNNEYAADPDQTTEVNVVIDKQLYPALLSWKDDNELQQYLDDANIQVNTTWTIINEHTALRQYASGEPSDLYIGHLIYSMLELLDHNVLLEDWTTALEDMPNTKQYLEEDNTDSLLNINGELPFLSLPALDTVSLLWVRQDWLYTLNLSVPQTHHELLHVARAFTKQDPDLNGERDTYAFTSDGSGLYLGGIDQLLSMWGPADFYLGHNTLTHPVLDGSHQSFLNFMKAVVNEQLIDPDWHIQGSEQMWNQVTLYERIGFVFSKTRPSDRQISNQYIWTAIGMPAARSTGGSYMPSNPLSYVVAGRSDLDSDINKLPVVQDLIDFWVRHTPGNSASSSFNFYDDTRITPYQDYEILMELQQYRYQYDIEYVFGRVDSYTLFPAEWLYRGGQDFIAGYNRRQPAR